MPSGCFIDTNLLLYLQDRTATEKAKRVAELLGALADHDLIVVNTQVLKEYTHNILRKFRDVSYDQLLAELEAMRPWCRAPLDFHTALRGLALHRRHRFSFYDACLVASALDYGCEMFLSEDLNHHQKIEGMRIINPFADDPRGHIQRN